MTLAQAGWFGGAIAVNWLVRVHGLFYLHEAAQLNVDLEALL